MIPQTHAFTTHLIILINYQYLNQHGPATQQDAAPYTATFFFGKLRAVFSLNVKLKGRSLIHEQELRYTREDNL